MLKKLLLSCLLSSFLSADGTIETVYFIGDDLQTGMKYQNLRYDDYGPKSFLKNKDFDKKNMVYVKPDSYTWKTKDGAPQLTFDDTNNYAFLEKINLKEDAYLKKTAIENQFSIILDGSGCVGTGCKLDENIISVVVPSKFKVIDIEAYNIENMNKINSPKFKTIDNTTTFYSSNIEGAYLKVWIEDIASNSSIYQDVESSLAKFSEIEVIQSDSETKIIMPMDNLFEPGKASIKTTGKNWLKELTEAIKTKNYKEIRIEGHTDNSPIKSNMYPSNWELSSARAADAVRYMISQGLSSDKVALVGYADTKPKVSNNTAENRAKNRRIEITIVGNSTQTTEDSSEKKE